jgi:hypothetical protein
MLRVVAKAVVKLSKNVGQVLALPTVSTCYSFSGFSSPLLYSLNAAANTQFHSRFAQALLAGFNQLSLGLYPVSTRPINNTNLIKEY